MDKITTSIELDIETAAKWFATLTDDEMCRFFVAINKEMQKFGPLAVENQWCQLGGHLMECECSNEETRQMLRDWVYWMETKRSQPSRAEVEGLKSIIPL